MSQDYHKACSSGRNSFKCNLNLRPFGNWLEDSPWQAEESGFLKKLKLPLEISKSMVAESQFAFKTQEWCEGFWTSTDGLEVRLGPAKGNWWFAP